jgi:spore coat protein H
MMTIQRDKSLGCAAWGCLIAFALMSCPPGRAADTGVKKKKAEAGAEFFQDPTVRVFDIKVPEAALMELSQSPRTYVSGQVTEGEEVLTNVGIRLKGMGSFRGLEEKPSFAVKFDEFVGTQSYRGLKKLMFNNSAQDSTYLAELLATQLFEDAGVPAAHVTHARVRLNDRDLGLYVVTEAMNKDFLKRHFGSGKGNLYEGYLQDVHGRLEQDNGDDESQADVRALHQACTVSDPAERWQRLNKVLDVDRFLSFIAMELLTTHWDGYLIHFNNYRLYHDPKTDKMVFITHGLDWAFRRPNVLIDPPQKSLVGRAVLTTPEGQKLYQERIRTLFAKVFKPSIIIDRMEQALEKIRRAGLKPAELARIERGAGIMRGRIQLRATCVDEQLRGIPPKPLPVDATGFGYPVSWREEPDRGDAIVDRVKLQGKETLHIHAREETTRASWRSQLCLLPGWYRFEGKACTKLTTGGSARLRISGDTRSVGLSGETGWQSLSHDFQVPEGSLDVELVCELNALHGGDVWFDLASLRVKRIAAQEARAMNRQPVLRQ